MTEFWVASGHHLTRLDAGGQMLVTDELLAAWLARPEILPPEEACEAERALYRRLMADPRAPVGAETIAALADPDARENWTFFLLLRDTLVEAGTVEAGYLALVRSGRHVPVIFLNQLVQLILRNALHGCSDVATLRAAEMMFRPQRGHVQDGALVLADEELVQAMETELQTAPLTAMFSGGAESLDILNDENDWTYWSRSDAHAMAFNFGGDPAARAGLASAMAAFLRHLMGLSVAITPLTGIADAPFRWFVGLDQVGTRIGNALWRGEPLLETMIGLFRLEFEDETFVRPEVAGQPVWLILGIGHDMSVRMKPQNLVMGLPLLRGDKPH